MDFKIRTTKTKSGSTAVQVVNYVKRKTVILKHIGSAKNESEQDILEGQAHDWILNYQNENSLFKNELDEVGTFNKTYKYLGVKISFAYEFLGKIYDKFNFDKHTRDLVRYLVLTQVLEPGSKRNAVRFLEERIGVKFNLTSVYNWMIKYDPVLKDKIEKGSLEIAKKHFGYDIKNFTVVADSAMFAKLNFDTLKASGINYIVGARLLSQKKGGFKYNRE